MSRSGNSPRRYSAMSSRRRRRRSSASSSRRLVIMKFLSPQQPRQGRRGLPGRDGESPAPAGGRAPGGRPASSSPLSLKPFEDEDQLAQEGAVILPLERI